MDPFTMMLLGSTALSGAGAGLNFFSGQQTNKQNMLMNTGAWKAQQVQAEASALGVSPLAILGNTGTTLPMQQVGDPGFGAMGQNLTRAASALADRDTRLRALQLQSAQLDVKAKENDVIAGQMRNSVNAAQLASPASPPPFPPPMSHTLGTKGTPAPMFEWYFDPDNPGAPPVKVISDKFAHTQFGPTAYYSGLMSMPGMVSGMANDFSEYLNQQGRLVRGDVLRQMSGAPPLPDYWSEYGGQ